MVWTPGPNFNGMANGVCDIFDTNNVNGVEECPSGVSMCYGMCYISHPTCPTFTTETFTTTLFTHPCMDGTSPCAEGHQCSITGRTTYVCNCANGFECTAGCEPPYLGHTCSATTSTTTTSTTTTSCLPSQQPQDTVCRVQSDGATLEMINCDCQGCAATLGQDCDYQHCVTYSVETPFPDGGSIPPHGDFVQDFCGWILQPGAVFNNGDGAERLGFCYTPAADACNNGQPCIVPGTLQLCEECLETEQCSGELMCCPTMKKCVVDPAETQCPPPHGQCSPPCHDADCGDKCANPDYPLSWQHPTCVMR